MGYQLSAMGRSLVKRQCWSRRGGKSAARGIRSSHAQAVVLVPHTGVHVLGEASTSLASVQLQVIVAKIKLVVLWHACAFRAHTAAIGD